MALRMCVLFCMFVLFWFIGIGFRIVKGMLGNLSWSFAIEDKHLELKQSLNFSRNNK